MRSKIIQKYEYSIYEFVWINSYLAEANSKTKRFYFERLLWLKLNVAVQLATTVPYLPRPSLHPFGHFDERTFRMLNSCS